jgi:hypothetical protein
MFDLPPIEPHIEISVASEGVSKGVRQTEGPQLVIRPELGVGPLTFGGYWKNVDSSSAEGEAGLSAALRQSLAGFDFGLSAAYKFNTSTRGPLDGEAAEFAGSVGRRIGPVTARASLTYSPDDLGSTGESFYWEGAVTYALRSSTRVSAALSRRERDGGPDYTAFNIGVTQTLWRGISADLRYFDTGESALGEIYEGRVVASLRARF